MLNDLIKVLSYLDEKITATNILTLYSQLAAHYTQALQTYTPETDQQIKDTLKQITQAHQQIEPSNWLFHKQQLFKNINNSNAVGISAANALISAINGNAANPQGAITRIEELKKRIELLQSNCKNILASLKPTETDRGNNQGEIELVEIVFDDDASVNNLVELSKRSEQWQFIIRAFSILAGEAPENTKILQASKNSPFLLLLSAPPLIARAIKATISPLLDLRKQYFETELTKTELVKQKMLNEVIANELEKIKQEKTEQVVAEIVESVSKEYKAPSLKAPELNEAKANVNKAVTYINEFIVAGGKVDVASEKPDKNEEAIVQFGQLYNKIELLEVKVNQLLGDGKKPETDVKKKTEENPQNPKEASK